MRTYSWNAEDYERHSQAQLQWARELLVKLKLSGAEKVLDLGCGDGKISAEIARLVPRGEVVGIDNSIAMVELAAGRHISPRYPNLSFSLMDVRRLSFTEYFDVIFSNAALHWVMDHQPVLEGIYRSLKPGGRILLQMGGKGNGASVLDALDEMIARSEWQPYFENFGFPYGFLATGEYRSMLSQAGFTSVRAELIPKDMVHNSISDFQGWIRTTWLPYTERVPEENRERFIQELSARYIDRVPLDDEGRTHVGMVRLEAAAEKQE